MASPTFPYQAILEKEFPQADYQKASINQKLHFMLVHGCPENNAKQFEWIQKQTQERLGHSAGVYQLTPLHIAVMKGNEVMFKFLVERGVSLTTPDFRRHTVLHHATICQNASMKALITAADKTKRLTKMKTDEGKTAADLEQLLSVQPLEPDQPAFNYFDEELQCVVYGATAAKFQEMTGARYTNRMITTSQFLADSWTVKPIAKEFQSSAVLNAATAYFNKQYEKYQKNPPVLYLVKHACPELGYEVCIDQELEAGEIVIDYLGENVVARPTDHTYFLEDANGRGIEGRNIRNLASMIDDGYPTLRFFPLQVEGAIDSTMALIARRTLHKGEKLYFDYHAHGIKFSPRLELNADELEKDFRTTSPTQLYKKLNPPHSIRQFLHDPNELSYRDFLHLDSNTRLLCAYLFATPAALVRLLVKDIVKLSEVLTLFKNEDFIDRLELGADQLELQQHLCRALTICLPLAKASQQSATFADFIIPLFTQFRAKSIYYLLMLSTTHQILQKQSNQDYTVLFNNVRKMDLLLQCIPHYLQNPSSEFKTLIIRYFKGFEKIDKQAIFNVWETENLLDSHADSTWKDLVAELSKV